MSQLPDIPREPDPPSAFAFLRDSWKQGLSPDPRLTVSEWADRHRILSSRGSNEAGPWRTSRTPYLREIMDVLSPSHPARRIILMKGSQVGAPLALDTPVPTPDGWKTIGTLEPGDWVFDENGTPTIVIGVSPVFVDRKCFEICFSDGAKITADAEHLWTVDDGDKKRTLSTSAIEMTFKCKNGKRNRYAIPVTKPLKLGEKDLPIHPYALGYWLGNGHYEQNQLSAHADDAREIAENFCNVGHRAEARFQTWLNGRVGNIIIRETASEFLCIREHDKRKTGTYLKIKRGKNTETCAECARQQSMHYQYGTKVDPVTQQKSFGVLIRAIGVWRNKHIPREYLRASREQRLALLQGLMDADGSITESGRCELSLSDTQLAEDAFELLVSLGLKPTVYLRSASEKTFSSGRSSPIMAARRFSFTAYRDCTPVFKLKRKLYRLPMMEGRRISETTRRRIVDVREVTSVPVRCISVASASNLFLAGREMIPTHNTEAGTNWVGFVIHHAPGPMLIVWPTLEMSQRNSKQRIDPMIAESPALSARVATRRSTSSSNTILRKEFEGGILVIAGSNSPVGLRSMPVRYLFLDETDVYPAFAGKGMDPIEEAIKRTSTFEHRSKIFMASTPTISEESRIEGQWLTSDQRKYFIPCPRCGHMQPLEWNRIRWEPGRYETVHYLCVSCEQAFFEHEKTWFLTEGEWRGTANAVDRFTVGFHLSSLYSPYGWLSWETCAKEWEAAQGAPERLRTFVTGVLGKPWRERTTAPDWKRLYDRREDWQIGTIPPGVRILTAGADVQRDRIEVSIWGWAPGFEAWLIDHIIIRGAIGDTQVRAELTGLLSRVWVNADGEVFQLHKLAIDSGDQSMDVYAWVQSVRTLPVMCIKGFERYDREAPVTGPKRIPVGKKGTRRTGWVDLWHVAVSSFKGKLFANLALDRPTDEDLAAGKTFPPGYVHLPRGTSSDFVQQLVAEQEVSIKQKNGRVRREWRKIQDRNEALDAYVYARAAMWEADIYGDVFWRRFQEEDERGGVMPPHEARPVPQGTWVPRVRSKWV